MIRGFLLPEKLFSLKRASTKCDRANGSVLEADCAAADFTEIAPFEEETGAGETLFPFSLSSSEDRYLKEIYKDRGELTVLCKGWK